MTTLQTEERTTLIADAEERQQAHDVLRQVGGHLETMTVGAAGGQSPVPSALAGILGRVLEAMANGRTVLIGSLPEELTTTVAAEQLGVSRPTLMKLIRNGEVPAHKVGTHHRLKAADVMAFKRERLARQRQALDDLRALERELDEL